jgi:Zn-finger nucleic acid-binding protein
MGDDRLALCPHCRTAMREVAAEAQTGYLILLDQCGSCGGIWCDRWELFPLSREEAERIDPPDSALLSASTDDENGPGRCPRCDLELRPFHDPLLPSDSVIERCPFCQGMWLNRGQLSRLRRHAPHRHAHSADVDALAGAYAHQAQWARVPNINAAFAAPPPDAEEPPRHALRDALWSAGAWVVLRALLRLLLSI